MPVAGCLAAWPLPARAPADERPRSDAPIRPAGSTLMISMKSLLCLIGTALLVSFLWTPVEASADTGATSAPTTFRASRRWSASPGGGPLGSLRTPQANPGREYGECRQPKCPISAVLARRRSELDGQKCPTSGLRSRSGRACLCRRLSPRPGSARQWHDRDRRHAAGLSVR